jgi:mRNA interferase MazF
LKKASDAGGCAKTTCRWAAWVENEDTYTFLFGFVNQLITIYQRRPNKVPSGSIRPQNSLWQAVSQRFRQGQWYFRPVTAPTEMGIKQWGRPTEILPGVRVPWRGEASRGSDGRPMELMPVAQSPALGEVVSNTSAKERQHECEVLISEAMGIASALCQPFHWPEWLLYESPFQSCKGSGYQRSDPYFCGIKPEKQGVQMMETYRKEDIRRGDIYYADLRPVVGSEQGGIRPVVILQNNVGNRHSPTVIAAAITSRKGKHKLPTHVNLDAPVPGLYRDSIILLEQLRTIDKSRLRDKLGSLGEDQMCKLDHALEVSVGLLPIYNTIWFYPHSGYRHLKIDQERSGPFIGSGGRPLHNRRVFYD